MPAIRKTSEYLITFLIVALLWFVLYSLADRLPGKIDFSQYWAAAKLFAAGENPYDQTRLLELQRPLLGNSSAVVMWNPPLILPLILPLAGLELKAGASLWTLLSLALVVWSWRMLDSGPIARGSPFLKIKLLFLLTFYPMALSIFYGQISPLLLAGLAGFYFNGRKDPAGRRSQFFAGLCLSLTLIKPHLLYLLYLFLALKALRDRALRFAVAGLICGGFLLMAAALVFQPGIISHYGGALSQPPIHWKNPVLGSWLQELGGEHTVGVRFLPTLIAACLTVLFSFFGKRTGNHPGVAELILALSLISAPYGWGYDQVLLLPLALRIFTRAEEKGLWWIAALLVIFNFVMFIMPFGRGIETMIWFPAALLLLRVLI